MATIDQLERQHERMAAVADAACDAAQDLARNANGNRGHIIPAPTAYALLGNLKVTLWHLNEVVEYLPAGLAASLAEPSIIVTDPAVDGPATSVQTASTHLTEAWAALRQASAALEAAQSAVSRQGYEHEPHP